MLRLVLTFFVKCASLFITRSNKIIVFGAFMGNAYGDNSAHFFEYCNKHRVGIYRYIWLSDNKQVINFVKSQKNREAYLKKSIKGIWISLRAGVFITSHGLEDVLIDTSITRRGKEIYLHHGIPIRGADGSGLNYNFFKNNRLMLMEKMVSTSIWAGEQQRKNFPVAKSKVLVTGLPRNDIFFNRTRDYVSEVRKKISVDGKVILYAPTWRKKKKTIFFPFKDCDLDYLSDFLRKTNSTIIIRPHSVDMKRLSKNDLINNYHKYSDVIKLVTVSEYSDTQDLMLISDILITDYSSIFYDYLLLDRPIFFFPYDFEEYESIMGAFLADYMNETPGEKIYCQESFIKCLMGSEDKYKKIRKEILLKVHHYRDGNSSKRIFDFISSL